MSTHATRTHTKRRSTTHVLLASAVISALAVGCKGDDPPEEKTAAKIVQFAPSANSVEPGGTVTLTWRTEHSTSVTVVASPGGTLVNESKNPDGSVVSGPLQVDTTFTLTAKGEGGDATRSVTVQVVQNMDVAIETFTVTPMTIVPGGDATLSYRVRNAERVRISVVNGEELLNSTSQFEGTLMVRPTVTTSYVLVAEGPNGPRSMTLSVVVEGTPSLVAFLADPAAIEIGQSTNLRWEVQNAANVVITDASGAEIYRGSQLSGSRQVSPTANETYTLNATSSLNQALPQAGRVTVTVNRAAQVQSFTVNPTSVDYGDPASLRWQVIRATAVEISAGGALLHSTTDLSGSLTVTATRTTTFQMVARNPDGDSTAMATLTVNPIAPRVSYFRAQPNPARIGGTADLSFSTIGATLVRLLDEAGDDVLNSTQGNGLVTVAVTSTTQTYTLRAINPHGATESTLALIGQHPPEIGEFRVRPLVFVGTATVATVTWQTTGVVTALTVNGAAVSAFPGTPSGSFSQPLTGTSELTLTASNAVGLTEATVQVVALVQDVEPNDDAATAIAIPGLVGGAVGTITSGDIDVYAITVAAGANLWAQVSNGQGGCAFDSFLTLYGPDGATVLGTDDDDGPGTCAEIDPLRDPFAVDLPAGTYFLAVRGYSASSVGPYTLLTRVGAASCGNRLIERSTGEQCDDGNTTAGDGCSATCAFEPAATVSGPGLSQSFSGAIASIGAQHYYRVEMSAAGYIGAEVFIPAVGRCDSTTGSNDPILTLLSDQGVVLGARDVGGIANCPRIDPRVDAFAQVPAGTYFLRLEEDGNNALISSYVLVVQTVGVGCGNGIIEAGEMCDDGNSDPNDGCDNACQLSGATVEVEPNGAFGTATPVALTGGLGIGAGAITAGDVDFFAVTVPAGAHLDAFLTVNSLDGCPTAPIAEVQVLGTNGSTVLTTQTTQGSPLPAGANCPRAWPYTSASTRAMAGGTYYVRVRSTSASAVLQNYFLHVRVLEPGCGNGIIEGSEQCDDGNTAAGDTCSPTCTFSPVATVDLPVAGTTTIAGSIMPSHLRHGVQVNVTAPIYLFAQTFAPTIAAGCQGFDTVLRLFNADGTTQLGTNDQGGISPCSRMMPGVDAYTRLQPGSYLLVTESYLYRTMIPAFDLVVGGRLADVCGNGVREAAVGEQCDDGNLVAGDGCSPTCQIEPSGVFAGPPLQPLSYAGSIDAVGKQDWYRVDVSAPGAILIARTGVPAIGQCVGGDTVLRLFNDQLGEITSNNDTGGTLCSLINGIANTQARLQPGTYWLRVEENGNNDLINAYELQAELRPLNTCGNGLVETGEMCDDGNLTSGDGCSASCTIEPAATFSGPPLAPTTVNSSIQVAGTFGFFQVQVSNPAILIAETGAPAIGACVGTDTLLRLYDSTLANQLASNDDIDGANNRCSRISGLTTAAARLQPGTYWLRVEDFGNNDPIPAYQLRVELRNQNECGNGLLEAGEACDDGNLNNGDGCSATCQFEIAVIPEVEPNNTPLTAQGLGVLPVGDHDIQAAIDPVGDIDFFSFTVNAQSSVQLVTYGMPGALFTSCPGDTQLWLYNGIPTNLTATTVGSEPTLVEYDDDDGSGACSLISGTATAPTRRTIPAGTYYVQVRRFNNSAIIPSYFLRISVQ